jgi:hypothetical protein
MGFAGAGMSPIEMIKAEINRLKQTRNLILFSLIEFLYRWIQKPCTRWMDLKSPSGGGRLRRENVCM